MRKEVYRVMRTPNIRRLTTWLLLTTLTLSGCRGRGSPTAPGTNTPAQVCRTFAVDVTYNATVTGQASFTFTLRYSGGRFDTSSNQLTHTISYSDSRGTTYGFLRTIRYRSTADFIGEVVRSAGSVALRTTGANAVTDTAASWTSEDVGRGIVLNDGFGIDNYRTITAVTSRTTVVVSGAPAVSTGSTSWKVVTIPPLTLKVEETATQTTGSISPFTFSFSYDAQNRLTQVVHRSESAVATTTYSAWDPFGRPIAFRVESTTGSFVYDDVNRIMNHIFVTPSSVATNLNVFDADGIEVQHMVTDTLGNRTTMTVNVGSTAQVCR